MSARAAVWPNWPAPAAPARGSARTGACARAQVRDVMVTGFVVAYLPVLAAATWAVHALWVVWAAKAAHNVWRLAGPPHARLHCHRRAGGWLGCASLRVHYFQALPGRLSAQL